MAATLQASSLSCLQKAVQSVKSTKAVSTRNASQKFVVSAKLTRTSVQEASVAAVKNIVGEDACRKLTNLSFIALNAYLTMPALAEEEKGKIFDFNLTLPIITVQFLLLAFGLNKLWFEPVGSFMDTRDDEIRKNLLNARDNSDELNKLRAEAEGLLKAARAESAAAIERETKKVGVERVIFCPFILSLMILTGLAVFPFF